MAIKYDETNRGDILRIVNAGAPGFAANGELVRVIERTKFGVLTQNRDGLQCEFVFNCGADRLEATEWKDDFDLVKQGSLNLESEEKTLDLLRGVGAIRAKGGY